MGLYPERAMERAMKIQEVIMRAVGGQITWWQAAEIIGISARSMRRWKRRYEEYGYDGLYDRRLKRPSPKRVPLGTVEKVLRLYREQYFDFNVKHFSEKLQAEHGIGLSYSWVKTALQMAGLVVQSKRRGKHRKRRPRRPLPGMLLHVDGSRHGWLPGAGQQDLIAVVDDATNQVYYGQLVDEESTRTVMAALKEVMERQGLCCSVYSDRGSHFFYTPKAGDAPERGHRTQIGRALDQLGIELIPAFSPQARGRCERFFGTWQGRLPQELRQRNLQTFQQANRFLREYWIPYHNQHFTVPATQPGTAFLPYTGSDLDKIFSRQEERVVQKDNTISFDRQVVQIEPQQFRFSMAGCRILVCQHLDDTLSLYYGPHLLGRYNAQGELITATGSRRKRRVA